MLGVADSRSGLTVLDLRQPEKDGGFHVLYHVPVEEIRNFQLVGDFVGVFHKFEPNVSFWNMMEQKTILCINIQVNEVLKSARKYVEDFNLRISTRFHLDNNTNKRYLAQNKLKNIFTPFGYYSSVKF